MKILLCESPGDNGYIESLISAYEALGHSVSYGVNNFYRCHEVPDILHIHWPESLYNWNQSSVDVEGMASNIEKRLNWFKEHEVKIVYTVHNIKPHDGLDKNDKDIFHAVLSSADILVHHCVSSQSLIKKEYSSILNVRQKNIVCRHGHYLIHYERIDKKLARAKYGIPEDKIVILNFGAQREYKNESFLLRIFENLLEPRKFLLIAGRFDMPAVGLFKIFLLKLKNRFRRHFFFSDRKYIYKSFPIDEIPYILSCADLAIAGQSHALNSGFLALAATYSLPVVTPDIGCFCESVENWNYESYTADNLGSAVEALARACKGLETKKNCDNSLWLENHSWVKHASLIIDTAANNL